ncbi:hypothetical protein ETU09_03320 [Apibacter muscae]|uniref:Uncharacterized protein n=1 Tax=Apibacter muscae TaxID=2509004 RepID=A0A563DHD4_9FLAO|nr:hypothetical protein [Apibacter muscae]TWP29263.1 hypothetical protein ETU09_03320 [Apibacter muscae]
MKTINRFTIQRSIIFIFVITLSCNQGIKENKAVTNKQKIEKKNKLESVYHKNKNNDTIYSQLIDITNALGGETIKNSNNRFTDTSIKFIGNSVLVDKEKLPFSMENIILEKIVGIGTRYEYFKEYIKEKFDIDINKKSTVNYLNFENDLTYNEGATYIYPYLFFYRINSNNYSPELLTFKLSSPILECIHKSTITLPLNKKFINETYNILDNNCIIEGASDWKYKGKFYYIPLPSKETIDIILTKHYSDSELGRCYILTIKNNKIIDKLYVEGDWDAPNNSGPDYVETTYFEISKDYKISVYTKYNGETTKINYKINDSGKFIELIN